MAESLVRFSVKEIPGLRDAQGRYTSAQRQQRELNRDLALVVQGRVTSLMRNHIAFGGRGGASTGRLLSVTANPRNIEVGNLSYGVGVPRYLDGSQAKYWRTFEEGSAAVWKRPFIGTQLLPVGRPTGPNPHGSRPGIRTASMDVPFLQGRFIVRREIEPAAIYRQVAREPEVGRDAVIAAVRFLNRVLGPSVRPGGGFLGADGSIQ